MPADAPAAEAVRADRQIKIRPTLFVALGGTGMEIMLRLRRRLLLADWNGQRIKSLGEFPAAAFLYLDTDSRDPRDSDQSTMRKDPFWRAIALEQAERIQEKIDVTDYQRRRRALPHIDTWLHDKDLSKIDTTHGAGQVRAISRLLFFHKAADIRGLASAKLNQLTANMSRADDLARLGLDIEPRAVRVVVLASTSGGTGSGTFLDAGYLLRSITNPKPDAVDLYLVLGGAFSTVHTQRTYANTFAALMELEHCSRRTSAPPFVEGWGNNLTPRAGEAPYNDVFLIDSANLGNMRTESREDLFNMLADILFEDFGNGDFANAKRSHASNTGKYKAEMDLYPVPPDLGADSQRFSLLYSSVGQAVIDTQARIRLEQEHTDCAKEMVRAFFGLAMAAGDRTPTPDEATNALEDKLYLRPTMFDRFPEYWDGEKSGVRSFDLVGELLRTESGDQTVIGILSGETTNALSRVRDTVTEIKDWPAAVDRAIDLLKINVEDEVGKDRAIVESNLKRRRETLLDSIAGKSGTLRSHLYAKLEDRERGGLHYAITLAKELQKRIGDETHGAIDELLRTADRFAYLASWTLEKTIQRSKRNLREAVQRRIFGPNREAANISLGHLQAEVGFYLECRTRARACAHAAGLLQDIAARIGAMTGADAEGREHWSGLIGEMVEGQQLVEDTLRLIDLDLAVLAEIRSRRSGTYLVLAENQPGTASSSGSISLADALDWGKESLDGYGGLQKLFEKLQNEAGRIEVINQVKGMAKTKLGHKASAIPDAVTVLADAGEEGVRVLAEAFRRAQPWVNADLNRINHISDRLDRRSILISVPDKAQFERRFMMRIRGFYDGNVSVHQTPERGRIVVYSEISGFPLHAIVPLDTDWYRNYREERGNRQKPPLHTHKDAEEIPRFPIPIALDEESLRRLQGDLAVFLKGVLLGLIRRDNDRGVSGAEGDIWWFEESNGMPLRLGRERTFRIDGLPIENRDKIIRAVSTAEQTLTALQILGLSVLMRHTSDRCYARAKISIHGGEVLKQGFTSKAAEVAANNLLLRLRALGGVPALSVSGDLTSISASLKDSLHLWTQEIPNSREDVDPNEVNVDPLESPEFTAQPKRRVRSEAFSTEALKSIIAPPAAVAPAILISGAVAPPTSMEVLLRELKALKDAEPDLPADVYKGKFDDLIARIKSL